MTLSNWSLATKYNMPSLALSLSTNSFTCFLFHYLFSTILSFSQLLSHFIFSYPPPLSLSLSLFLMHTHFHLLSLSLTLTFTPLFFFALSLSFTHLFLLCHSLWYINYLSFVSLSLSLTIFFSSFLSFLPSTPYYKLSFISDMESIWCLSNVISHWTMWTYFLVTANEPGMCCWPTFCLTSYHNWAQMLLVQLPPHAHYTIYIHHIYLWIWLTGIAWWCNIWIQSIRSLLFFT